MKFLPHRVPYLMKTKKKIVKSIVNSKFQKFKSHLREE